MKLILASSSPRRQQLLTDAGYVFEVDPPHQDAETAETGDVSPIDLVALLAFRKARDVANRRDDVIVLAADTVAECEGKVLGKPADIQHARDMLQFLSGKSHFVHTGLCLWSRPDDRHIVRTCTTELVMHSWEPATLEAYLKSGDWRDKAGSFGYQDGLEWVQIVTGSESNVVGLPMELLASLLTEIETGSYQLK